MIPKNFWVNFFIISVAIFDRLLLKQNRDRASFGFEHANFLNREVADIIIQTIEDCKENFSDVLELGAKDGFLGKNIKCKNLTQVDLSPKMVEKYNLNKVADDEELSFDEQSFDLIVSNLNLHFINDIPQNLIKIRKLLRPKGMFIASFFGEENLKELKEIFLQTEQKIYGGVSPRIAPNVDIKSAGMLLQKAGFTDVIVEKHTFEVEYSDLKKLFSDLRNMGQTNILNDRSKKFMTKNFLFELTNLYKKLYSRPDSHLLATFEIIILTGWIKPSKK